MSRTTVTIRDVAQVAGVSKTTAVHVLNNVPHFKAKDATRQRVVEAAVQLGYRRNAVASALACGRIHTIGVVAPLVSGPWDNRSPLHSLYAKEMLVTIAEAARQVGLRISLIPLNNNDPVSSDEVSDGRVDGLILVQVHNPEQVRVLYDSGLPCVAITAEHSPRSVRPDNRGGATLATEHLIALGHRRIAHRANHIPGEAARERQAGFEDTIGRQGLSPMECPISYGCEETQALLQQSPEVRPTAVFAFNDTLALETLRIARSLGLRVPEDLSVVGFDNNVLASVCEPPLTTIHNPLPEQAAAAIALLEALWRNEEPPALTPIPTRLVVRASCGPPDLSLLS
jgi:DNA-binding LacI/PurR family transcriptional regulator